MRFTVSAPLEQVKLALLSHQSEMPVLADTDIAIHERGDYWDAPPVEILRRSYEAARNTPKTPATSIDYILKRQWKGGRGSFHYPVMGLSGRLEATSASETTVTLKFDFYFMGYGGIVGILIGLLLIGSPSNGGLGLIVFFGIIALFLIDFYVLFGVYKSLRSGMRI